MKIINDLNLPESFVAAIANDDYDGDPNKISVTTFIDDPHMLLMKQKYADKIEVPVSKLLWAFYGSAIHYVLERAGSMYIRELRLETRLANGFMLSGKLDIYDPKTRTLSDYKSVKTWAVKKNPTGKFEWIAQLNVNRYLLRKHGIEVDNLEIIAILLNWDFKESFNPDYPKNPIERIPIDIWSDEMVEGFLQKRMEEHAKADTYSCSVEGRWKREDVYAVAKDKYTYRNCKTKLEAEAILAGMKNNSGYSVKFVAGKDIRCEEYCYYNKFCPYYQERYLNMKPFEPEEIGWVNESPFIDEEKKDDSRNEKPVIRDDNGTMFGDLV